MISFLLFGFFGILAGVFSAQSPSLYVRDSALTINQIIKALEGGFISHIEIFITLSTLANNMVDADFNVTNPVPLEFTLDQLTASASVNGSVFVQINQTFTDPVVISPSANVNSGQFGDVVLSQGAIATLNIIPLGSLNLTVASASVRVETVNGDGGIPLVISFTESNVPTQYSVSLDPGA